LRLNGNFGLDGIFGKDHLEAEYMTVLDEILAEGELRGIEKGREEGIEKGKLETAKNMKAEGIAISVILKVTGLTDEQLKDAGVL
jgi:predicted transposase/invertase (TIGR01784 family)